MTRLRLSMAALALLAAVLGALWAFGIFGGTAAPAPTMVPGEAMTRVPVPPIVAGSADPAPLTEPGVRTEAGTGRRPVVATTAVVLRGRCVDEAGGPLGGCSVRLLVHRDGSAERTTLDEQHTLADGRVEVTTAEAAPYLLVALAAPGRVAAEQPFPDLPAGSVHDFGDVVLPGGCTVSGSVRDTLGNPRAFARVTVRSAGARRADAKFPPATDHRATCGPDGAFVLGALLPGDYFAEVRDELLVDSAVLTIPAHERRRSLDLTVEVRDRLPTIRGTVVDEHGAPVAGAEVSGDDDSGNHFAARTLTDGAFVLHRTVRLDGGPVQILAAAEGLERERVAEPVEWGRRDLRLVLRATLTVEVTVVAEATGRSVEHYGLRWQQDPPRRIPGFGVRERGHHPAGRTVLTGVRRGSYVVRAEPDDAAWWPSALLRVEVTDPGPVHVRIGVPRAASRRLELTAVGAEVRGCRIELAEPWQGAVGLEGWIVPIDRWENYRVWPKALLVQEGTTDERGSLALRGPAGRTLVLRVLGPGCVPKVFDTVRLEGDGPLRLQVLAGGRLRLRASPPEVIGELAALARPGGPRRVAPPGIVLRRGTGSLSERIPERNGPPIPFSADGTLDYRGIPPGIWDVVVVWQEGWRQAGQKVHTVALSDGGIAEVAVDLTPLGPMEVRGGLLLNGAPAARQALQILVRGAPAGGTAPVLAQERVETDGGGNFVYRGRAGRVRVEALVEGGGQPWLAQPRDLHLMPGSVTEQQFTVSTGGLALRFVDSAGLPVPGLADVRLLRGPLDYATTLPVTGADGRALMAQGEAGTFTLRLMPRRFQQPEARAVHLREHPDDPTMQRVDLDLGTITVVPGRRTEQDVTVPADYFR